MFGYGLSRFLPFPLRHAIGSVRRRLRMRRLLDLRKFRRRKTFSGEHVAVAGLFRTRTGIGRAAELVALTLQRRGHRVTRIDVSQALGLQTLPLRPDCLQPADCKDLAISDVVIVVNPDHPAVAAFDRTWLVGRCVIGHWIWEVEALPSFWQSSVISYDEIWAPTELVRDVIRAGLPETETPIKLLPYAIDLDPMPAIVSSQRDEIRSRLGLAGDVFVAGYSFAVDSNYYRKNPEDAVRAFIRAFPPAEEGSARLLLRCNDFAHRPVERAQLQALIGSDPRILIFDADNRIGITDFYAAIDVYLSTSRAEGYGLNLVEAAQAGLPVISCGWRIAPEIAALPGIRTTGYDLIPLDDPQGHYAGLAGARWAAPHVAEIVEILRGDRDAFRRARGRRVETSTKS
jgi:glycosyltransferase involved in cell wall biosynthesis